MGKKLENNGLWESSRMIIPQHKESALWQETEIKRIPRPALDDQEIELVSAAIGQSYSLHAAITLSVYDVIQYRDVTGVVSRVDQQLKRLRIDIDEDQWEWVNMPDILKADIE